MKKNMLRVYITLAIVLVVLTVIALAVPFAKTASFWIAYAFGVIAIGYQVYVFNISFAKGEGAKSKFYGFPIAKIGVVYLIVQLVVSLVEMCVAAWVPAWATIIINVIPIAVAAVGCIAAETMRDEIVHQEEQVKKDISNMTALRSMSTALVSQCSDEALKSELKKLADEFRYSDPVTSEETKDVEKELEVQLNELQNKLSEKDFETAKNICVKLNNDLAERNRICVSKK